MIRTLETFPARIYTPMFRAYGTIHLPPAETTEGLLNAMARQLLPVTDPLIYAPGTEHPPDQGDLKVSAGFLAVHYDQIDWMVGGRPPQQGSERRRMAFLYTGHVLVGYLRVPAGARSSDFLETAATFQTLFEVELYPWQAPPGRFLLLGTDVASLFEVGALQKADDPVVTLEASQRFPFVTVNLRRVTGVLEAPRSSEAEARIGVFGTESRAGRRLTFAAGPAC